MGGGGDSSPTIDNREIMLLSTPKIGQILKMNNVMHLPTNDNSPGAQFSCHSSLAVVSLVSLCPWCLCCDGAVRAPTDSSGRTGEGWLDQRTPHRGEGGGNSSKIFRGRLMGRRETLFWFFPLLPKNKLWFYVILVTIARVFPVFFL